MLIRKIVLLLLIITVFAIPVFAQEPFAKTTNTAEFVPGEIIVKFQPHVGALGAQASLRVDGFQPLSMLSYGSDTLLRVQVIPGQEAEAIAKLLARGDVEAAEYNYILHATWFPNDPLFYTQWALNQSNGHDINAPEAWDIYKGGNNITVAIVDTGVDLTHPDLQANIVSGYNAIDPRISEDDDNGHGSHIAGIIAAAGNNSIGIAGVNPYAKIMPVKALDSAGSGSTFDVAKGIDWAVRNGANIINLSLGAGSSSWPCGMTAVEDAFNFAAANGVLVVVASGNDGQNGVNCPGAYDNVISVGSTTQYDKRSSFSNYGTRLDIVAPGTDIYSTINNGSYAYLSGTSMATPHVAGLAALIWSFSPTMTSNQVRDNIQNNADDIIPESGTTCGNSYASYIGQAGWDPCFGYGRINAWRSMTALTMQSSTENLSILMDNNSNLPITNSFQVTIASTNIISWHTSISPTVSWLKLTSPTSGTVAYSPLPLSITMATTRPITYGIYSTAINVTGVTSSGLTVGPVSTQVNLTYQHEIYTPTLQSSFTENISIAIANTSQSPITNSLQISITTTNIISWQISISPTVSWLKLTSPTSGTVAYSPLPLSITMATTRPITYGIYATAINIDGITTSGLTVGPVSTQINLTYQPIIYRYNLPIIIKQ